MQILYYIEEKPVLAHNQEELENDLIGNYFEVNRKAPEYQFGNFLMNFIMHHR
jgi:hypothetical protein